MTDSRRSRQPVIPPSAVVWAVRLAHKPPTRERLVTLCRGRWGAHYFVNPSRVRSALDYAVKRGWLTVGDGVWAVVREPDDTRFMVEHDPSLLRGHDQVLQSEPVGVMVAWRQAHGMAKRDT